MSGDVRAGTQPPPPGSSTQHSSGEKPSIAQLAELHHIGIVTSTQRHPAVVESLMTILGGTLEDEVEDELLDITATWVQVSPCLRFEVVSPRSDKETAITTFLTKTGGGLHHVSLATTQIGACRDLAAAGGAQIVGESDDHGGWAEFFIDPRQTGGALLHWMQAVDSQ